jgi:hypothetical protein
VAEGKTQPQEDTMAYTGKNYKTKKALKEDLANGVKVTVYQPGSFGGNVPKDGPVYLEGPHYPEPHRWYAKGMMAGGYLVSIK